MSHNTLTSFGALNIPFESLLAYRNGRAAAIENRFREAIGFFDQALTSAELPSAFHARALEQRADCHRHLGEFDEAEQDLQQVLLIADSGTQVARALVFLGEVADARGHHDEALATFGRGLDEAIASDDRVMIGRAHRGLGIVYRRLGDTDRSLDHLTSSLSALRALGDAREQASALTSLGLTHFARGSFQEAIAAYNEALRIQDALGEQWQAILTLNSLGECHQSLYDVAAAYRYHQRAFRIAQAYHAPGMLAMICHNLGVDLMELGRSADARAYLEQSLEDSARLNRPDIGMRTLFELTRLHLRNGDLEQAEQTVAQLDSVRDQLGTDQAASLASFALGELLFAQGRRAEAASALQAAALSAQTALDRSTLWKLHAAMSQMVAEPHIAQVHLTIAAEYIRQTAEPLEDEQLKRTFLLAPPVMAVLYQAGFDPERL